MKAGKSCLEGMGMASSATPTSGEHTAMDLAGGTCLVRIQMALAMTLAVHARVSPMNMLTRFLAGRVHVEIRARR